MKKIMVFLGLSLALAVILSSLGAPAFAQWEPDVRLTYNDSDSYTSNDWCVTASGDTVYVVWFDRRDGNYEVYFKRSSDGGAIWGPDIRLTNDTAWSDYPSIAVSGSNVHVAWQDYRDKALSTEIYYKRSTDSGANWSNDTRLTYDSAYSYLPSIAVLDSLVHIVWADERDGMFNFEIYYKRSTDGGANWGSDIRLTNDPAFSFFPSVSVSDSCIHVVWVDGRSGNDEIYYKRSTDLGTTWEPDTRLTYSNSYARSNPSVAVSGQTVHVVWMDGRDGRDAEIYYKRSTTKGNTWGLDNRLTYDPAASYYPSVAVMDSLVHLVWCDRRDGNYEIYYKGSTDGGTFWRPDVRLTNSPDSSIYPSISVSGLKIHIVWCDTRDRNTEIYYKRNPTGNSGIEETMDQGFEGTKSRGIRATPNPFTVFSKIPGHEGDRFMLYDISGRMAGTYKGDRIGEDLSPGVYFVKEVTRAPFIQRVVKVR